MITQQQIDETFADLSQQGLYAKFFEKMSVQLDKLRDDGTLKKAETILSILRYDVEKLSEFQILYIYTTLP